MAYAFATNQEITATTPAARNQSKFTFAVWVRRGSGGSFQNLGFLPNGSNWFGIIHFSDNNIYNAFPPNAWARTSQNITGWNHYAYVFDGTQTGNTNRIVVYINGTSQTLTFNNNVPSSIVNNSDIENFNIGKDGANGTWSTGDFAELGMWREALTAGEVNSLAKGFSPKKVRPQSLYTYIPLVRNIQDTQRALTLTNTNATVATHPRVYA